VAEILGIDPLYIANEGKLVAIVARDHAARALELMRSRPDGAEAALIGEVTGKGDGRLQMTTLIGGVRAVEMLSGEQLPRIC
jgi:hydrogenase expression/formation protein HypE